MIKELYRIETVETSLNVTQGTVDSVRRKHIVKSGCRVYKDGCIGVAGEIVHGVKTEWLIKTAEGGVNKHIRSKRTQKKGEPKDSPAL